jgi:hypothetical protein
LFRPLSSTQLHSSFRLTDQFSHPFRTGGEMIFLHVQIARLRKIPDRVLAGTPWIKFDLNFFCQAILRLVCFRGDVGLLSSEIWRRVTGWLLPDVSRQPFILVLKGWKT